jgi:hypothetical protein
MNEDRIERIFEQAAARFVRARIVSVPLPTKEVLDRIKHDLQMFMSTTTAKFGLSLLQQAGERIKVGIDVEDKALYYLDEHGFGVSFDEGDGEPMDPDYSDVVKFMIASGYYDPREEIGSYLERRLSSIAEFAPRTQLVVA